MYCLYVALHALLVNLHQLGASHILRRSSVLSRIILSFLSGPDSLTQQSCAPPRGARQRGEPTRAGCTFRRSTTARSASPLVRSPNLGGVPGSAWTARRPPGESGGPRRPGRAGPTRNSIQVRISVRFTVRSSTRTSSKLFITSLPHQRRARIIGMLRLPIGHRALERLVGRRRQRNLQPDILIAGHPHRGRGSPCP